MCPVVMDRIVNRAPAKSTKPRTVRPRPSSAGAAVAGLPATQSAALVGTRSASASLAISAPVAISGGGGGGIVANAMRYLGSRYVFGGTSPAGFDCSGFVWYVHKISGIDVSRGLWGQLNGGARVPLGSLQPGDTVFFANTYMAGLSHAGIYVGGGQFIHAVDESQGVAISSLNSGYWASHYVGASRIR